MEKINSLFPASAGMIPRRILPPRPSTAVPCECGDDPQAELGQKLLEHCSLRVRG